MFERVHHIGMAVRDMDAAVALYESVGGTLLGRETSIDGTVELSMIQLGDGSMIEPISPTTNDSSLAQHLDQHGEGLHHIAYTVKDIVGALEQLRNSGHTLIDEVPRPGFGGKLIAFVQAETTMGALWELVEE